MSKQLGETCNDFLCSLRELTKVIVADIILDSDTVIPTSLLQRRRRRPRRGRDEVKRNLSARCLRIQRRRRRPRRGRDEVMENLHARRLRIQHRRRRPRRGRDGSNPTRHRPGRLVEEPREDEATMSFIKPDDSVLLVRLKGEV